MIVVEVGAVKIHEAAAVEVLRKKEGHDETQFITRIDGFQSVPLPPSHFCRF